MTENVEVFIKKEKQSLRSILHWVKFVVQLSGRLMLHDEKTRRDVHQNATNSVQHIPTPTYKAT